MPRQSRPPKPYPDFPLYANQNGQWAKKIKGVTRYFGAWGDDLSGERAIEKYRREVDYLRAGETIPDDTSGMGVGELVNRFLGAKEEQLKTGGLSARSLAGYTLTATLLVQSLGRHRPIASLRPSDFLALRSALANGRGIVSLANQVRHARMIFRWAYDMDFVDRPIRLGPEFREPPKAELRRERERKRRERGDRSLSRGELSAVLGEATGQLRAMVLLGINCGFGATDCASLPRSAIDIDAGWIDFARVKTAVDRRCPLWPQTIDALRIVLDSPQREPVDAADADLVFLTKYGRRWTRMKLKTEDGKPDTWITIDSVGLQFGKLLRKLEIKRQGVNFYALRHTFQTIGEETGDNLAIARIMGHIDSSMSDLYRERFPDSRLLAVSNHVREWLFSEPSKK